MTFNIQQLLTDKQWEVMPRNIKYEQKYNYYTKTVEQGGFKHTYEFEIYGNCLYKKDAISCQITEKGMYGIYYVLFFGAIGSKEELNVIFQCIGVEQ